MIYPKSLADIASPSKSLQSRPCYAIKIAHFLEPAYLIFEFCATEGGVFYSEQQFVNAGVEGDDLGALSGQQAVARFGEFIRNFQEDRNTNVYPYA